MASWQQKFEDVSLLIKDAGASSMVVMEKSMMRVNANSDGEGV